MNFHLKSLQKLGALSYGIFFAWAACAAGTAHAQVVMSGPSVQITVGDLQAETRLMPPDAGEMALSRPDQTAQLARILYNRRALAQEAEKQGLQREPEIEHALSLAREKLLADFMLLRVQDSVKPSDSVLEQYVQSTYRAHPERFDHKGQTRARHILIRKSGSVPDPKVRAEQLLKELRDGANFEQMARQYSADQSTGIKGGDLGYFGPGSMVRPFDEAVSKLTERGELSDVVQTEFGYHIIRLEDRRPPGRLTVEQARPQLEREAESKLRLQGRDDLVKRLQQGSKLDEAAIEAFVNSRQP